MTVDPRRECVICAWREKCAKKFKSEKGVAHCADFTRDETLPAEDEQAVAPEKSHKKIVDPFAD
ncbi:hypothetical protein EPN96_08120 [bacterium]|nr:MAG: hypothetical protein EPN96_08120 [bacterium]